MLAHAPHPPRLDCHASPQHSAAASRFTLLLKDLARILAISFLLPAAAQAGQQGLEFETFAGHDGNPSHGQAGNGIAGEDIYGASLNMLRSELLDEHSGLTVRGGTTLLEHARFSGLNELVLAANLRYRVQPTIGYTRPWYQLSLDLERHQFACSAMRDATHAAIELTAGKRFTDRLDATVGIALRRGLADHGEVFDLSERRLFLAAGYKFGPANTLYASLSHASGDQVFGADESSYLRGNIKASAEDPVFGKDIDVYRMAASTTSAEVGVNLPLRGAGAWDLSAKHSRAYANDGPAYAYRQILLSWRYRFF